MGNLNSAIDLSNQWLDQDQANGNPSTEIALLLYCARTPLSYEHIQEIKSLLAQDINWPVLIRLSRKHGVLPLLYQNLKLAGETIVDEQALAQLRDYSQGTAFQNVVFTRALLKILDLLAESGI